jgi:hypothetical protein
MVAQMIDNKTNSVPGSADPRSDKKDRRRFLGAGVAATPFLLTMVSQPALGVTCFTPSRSLSKNTSVSQQGKYGNCTDAESPGNYKTQTDPAGNAYHWPSWPQPNTPMHDIFAKGSTPNVTKFMKSVNRVRVSQTLAEALAVNAPGQVHFHIIGAYLNKKGGNGAVIPDNVITDFEIVEMWRQFAVNGFYKPMDNVQWWASDIVTYLKTNGIVL